MSAIAAEPASVTSTVFPPGQGAKGGLSARHLRRVFDSSPDLICIVDTGGNVLRVNRATEQVLGFLAGEIVGASMYQFFRADRAEFVKSYFARALAGETLHNIPGWHTHRDGRPLSINWSVTGVQGEDALVCIGRDITEAKNVEKELRAVRRRSQVILDSIMDGFVSVDHEWRFTYVNGQVQILLGRPTYELLGRTIWDVFPASIGKDVRSVYEEAVSAGTPVTFSGYSPEAQKWLELRVYPYADGVTVLLQDVTQLKDKEAQLQHIAQHDGLTDLPNRRMCLRLLDTAVTSFAVTGRPVTVLFVDIDLFKTVNDSYGHDAGDLVLVELARRFTALAGAQGFVSRISGDEFVFLLEGLSQNDTCAFAQAVLEAVSTPISIGEADVTVGASVGIASYPEAGLSADELLRNADVAMYAAKTSGRNAYRVYCEELASEQRDKRTVEQQIRKGLREDEFCLHFQPQISLSTGAVIGAEALIRWNHPERGLLLPGQFIPVAEESTLVVSLGEMVLEKACRQIHLWDVLDFPVFPLAVNLSARQLCCAGLPDFIARMLDKYELDPARLHLEITESMLMADLATASAVLRRLQEMGIKVALDDFGTGYSNLAYIKQFPISTLKIDRSFVGDLEKDENARLLTSAVVSLGKSLRLEVLAEGVETEQQRDFLEQAGCDNAQGYHFSRPLPIGSFNDFVSHHKATVAG
jgi:diguanylate cyclase (GGDEF)-like protein/PAS domain S-box-containing protein